MRICCSCSIQADVSSCVCICSIYWTTWDFIQLRQQELCNNALHVEKSLHKISCASARQSLIICQGAQLIIFVSMCNMEYMTNNCREREWWAIRADTRYTELEHTNTYFPSHSVDIRLGTLTFRPWWPKASRREWGKGKAMWSKMLNRSMWNSTGMIALKEQKNVKCNSNASIYLIDYFWWGKYLTNVCPLH